MIDVEVDVRSGLVGANAEVGVVCVLGSDHGRDGVRLLVDGALKSPARGGKRDSRSPR